MLDFGEWDIVDGHAADFIVFENAFVPGGEASLRGARRVARARDVRITDLATVGDGEGDTAGLDLDAVGVVRFCR